MSETEKEHQTIMVKLQLGILPIPECRPGVCSVEGKLFNGLSSSDTGSNRSYRCTATGQHEKSMPMAKYCARKRNSLAR